MTDDTTPDDAAALPPIDPGAPMPPVQAPLQATTAMVPTFFGLTADTMDAAVQIAERIAGSSLCPTTYRNKPDDVLVAGAYAASLGIEWLQGLAGVAVINGIPAVYGDLFRALVLGHPDCEDVQEFFENDPGDGTFPDDMVAVARIKRRGQTWVERRFSVGDARRARLWDERPTIQKDGKPLDNPSPWYRFPRDMLEARAFSRAARRSFADRLRGIWHVEEARDADPFTIDGDYQVVEDEPSKTARMADELDPDRSSSPPDEAAGESSNPDADPTKSPGGAPAASEASGEEDTTDEEDRGAVSRRARLKFETAIDNATAQTRIKQARKAIAESPVLIDSDREKLLERADQKLDALKTAK